MTTRKENLQCNVGNEMGTPLLNILCDYLLAFGKSASFPNTLILLCSIETKQQGRNKQFLQFYILLPILCLPPVFGMVPNFCNCVKQTWMQDIMVQVKASYLMSRTIESGHLNSQARRSCVKCSTSRSNWNSDSHLDIKISHFYS